MFTKLINDIVNARMNHTVLTDQDVNQLSGISISQAYELQKEIIDGAGVGISGWKLGGTNSKTREVFNVKELYWGAVFEGEITNSSSKINLERGEVEIAFKLNKNIETLSDEVTLSELDLYIESVSLSIEYPWSTFKSFGKAGVLALITDCCASGQCLLGRAIPFDEFNGEASVDVEIDGVIVESGSSKLLVDGLYNTLCDFINNAHSRDFSLKKDQWVFTGGITSCRVYKKDMQVMLKCDGLPDISFKVV